MKQYRVIPLTKGCVAIIDAKNYRRVNKYSWHVHTSRGTKKKVGQPYARGKIDGKKVYLHRFIMNAPSDKDVDHLNHCTLDCREENLKVTDKLENCRRTRRRKKLVATIELSNLIVKADGVVTQEYRI